MSKPDLKRWLEQSEIRKKYEKMIKIRKGMRDWNLLPNLMTSTCLTLPRINKIKKGN